MSCQSKFWAGNRLSVLITGHRLADYPVASGQPQVDDHQGSLPIILFGKQAVYVLLLNAQFGPAKSPEWPEMPAIDRRIYPEERPCCLRSWAARSLSKKSSWRRAASGVLRQPPRA